MLTISQESHVDHALSQGVLDYIIERYKDRDGFFIDTFTLPPELGEVPCGLHGPATGDSPVPDSECVMEVRGERGWPSRLCDRPIRNTTTLTVIAGPHEDEPCVLYTAFGGPLAPKEPGDTSLSDEQRIESVAFWKDHALSR